MTTQAGPYKNVRKLTAFFQTHPNESFSADEICESTGIPRGSLHGSFLIFQRGHKGASQPGRGFYRYDPPTKAAAKLPPSPPPLPLPTPEPTGPRGELLEVIGGPTGKGELVLQSEIGEFFLAHRL